MRGGRGGCAALLLPQGLQRDAQPLCPHTLGAAPLLPTVMPWVMPSPGRQNSWAWGELWCFGSHLRKIPGRLDAAQIHLTIIHGTRPGPTTAANALGTRSAPACEEQRHCHVPNPSVTARDAGIVVPALLRFRTAWEDGGMLRGRSSTPSTRQAPGPWPGSETERDVSSPDNRNTACPWYSALAS